MAVRQRMFRLRRTLWLVALLLLPPSLALSQPSVVGQWSGGVDWPPAPGPPTPPAAGGGPAFGRRPVERRRRLAAGASPHDAPAGRQRRDVARVLRVHPERRA